MSVGKREPVPLLGRVQTWGIAKHGLVRDGTITLANASTEPHAQPLPAPGIAEWTSGDVLYVKRPGWTGPQIDPAEQAALIAAGLDFRDYALISGGQRSIGNTGSPSLDGGWLQFDGSGTCWRWRLTSVTGTATAAVMSFQRRRFGLFDGQAYDPATYSTPAFSLRQDDLPLLRAIAADGSTIDVPTDTLVTPYLVSTTPDGIKSLWMLMVEHNKPSGTTFVDRPMGFVEVTISGTSVSAQAIRSRAECVGAFSAPTMDIGVTLYVKMGRTTTETFEGVCGSGRDIIRFVEEAAGISADTDSNGGNYAYQIVQGFDTAGGVVGQIIAMWYDAAGVLHEITLDIDHTHTVSHSVPSSSYSGQIERVTDCATSNGWIETGSVSWSRTDSYVSTETCTWRIRDNGVERLSKTVTRTGSATIDFAYTAFADGSNTGLPGHTWSHTNSVYVDGVLLEQRNYGPSNVADGSNPINADAIRSAMGAVVDGGWRNHVDTRTVLYNTPTRVQLWAQAASIDLARYSAQVVGMRDARSNSGGLNSHEFGNVLTPAGVIPHSESVSLAPGERVRVTGSYEPVQHAFASSVSVDDPGVTHERVCWV